MKADIGHIAIDQINRRNDLDNLRPPYEQQSIGRVQLKDYFLICTFSRKEHSHRYKDGVKLLTHHYVST